jgi:hypothetical protein
LWEIVHALVFLASGNAREQGFERGNEEVKPEPPKILRFNKLFGKLDRFSPQKKARAENLSFLAELMPPLLKKTKGNSSSAYLKFDTNGFLFWARVLPCPFRKD